MTKRGLFLLILLSIAGCQSTPLPENRDEDVRDDASKVLDLVLAHWCKEGPYMRSVEDLDEAIILMRKNLPEGYRPRISGRRILIADYFIAKRSSYTQFIPQHRVLRLDGTIGMYDDKIVLREGEDNIGPNCLHIDKMEIRGDTGRIEISRNRRFNMGSNGGTYELKRTDSGWTFELTNCWQS